MKRFDARRQNENETLVEYEQALRMLHREGLLTATIELRDAALKRRFEEGLLSHTRTVVRECFKDEASEWKRPKFDPSHPKTP